MRMNDRVEKLVNRDEHGEGKEQYNRKSGRVRALNLEGRWNPNPLPAKPDGNEERDANGSRDELHHHRSRLANGLP